MTGLDPHTLDVRGRRIRAERVLIATGAQAETPTIAGLDGVPYLTYESVFDLTALPARLIVRGGGPVGVEVAQAFRRLGSQVTLIDRHDRVPSVADPEGERDRA